MIKKWSLISSWRTRSISGRRSHVAEWFCLGTLQVPILTIEDLILLKTLAGRLQDQADLEKISARQDELRVDWDYVEEWKTRLGLSQ